MNNLTTLYQVTPQKEGEKIIPLTMEFKRNDGTSFEVVVDKPISEFIKDCDKYGLDHQYYKEENYYVISFTDRK